MGLFRSLPFLQRLRVPAPRAELFDLIERQARVAAVSLLLGAEPTGNGLYRLTVDTTGDP
jgi:hypothetical protein